MPNIEGIVKLLERLAAAGFTGEPTFRMEADTVASATLHHSLENSEFTTKPIPTVEEFKLKP